MSTQSLIDKLFLCIKSSPYGVLKSTLCNSEVVVMKKMNPNDIRRRPRLIETCEVLSCWSSTAPKAITNDVQEIKRSFDTLAVNRFDADSCILNNKKKFFFFSRLIRGRTQKNHRKNCKMFTIIIYFIRLYLLCINLNTRHSLCEQISQVAA